jgi:hypothetical protein
MALMPTARTWANAAAGGPVVWNGPDGTGANTVRWLDELTTPQRVALVGEVFALGLLAGLVWVLVHLLCQNGRMLLRLDTLEARLAGDHSVPSMARQGAPAQSPTRIAPPQQRQAPLGPAVRRPGGTGG